MRKFRFFLISVVVFFTGVSTICFGQDVKTVNDSLRSITVLADSVKIRPAGLTKIDAHQTRFMVTALGEGDVIKYIQTLPGISTGTESSSSFYVRGGNLGNNVITLDGVRIYGYGHLLGITSVFPNSIVEDVSFNVGGFDAESYNLLASHIKIETKDGNFTEAEGEASVSNFILSGYITAPIVKNKVSVVASARVSPLRLEYKAGKSILEHYTRSFNDIEAGIYDVFGKVSYKINGKHQIFGEVFYSMDDFGYGNAKGTAYDRMEWYNFIGNIRWDYRMTPDISLQTTVSYNKYGSDQNQEKSIDGTYNRLGVCSLIEESVFGSKLTWNPNSKWRFLIGVRGTLAAFDPGSSKIYGATGSDGKKIGKYNTDNFLGTAYGEVTYRNGDRSHMKIAVKRSEFISGMGEPDKYSAANTEFSASAGKRLAKWIGIEATYDNLSQYYHTLEGIPLGWSLDMIVPSSEKIKPEKSVQYYAGMFFKYGNNRLSVGGYYKELDNLIHFSEATKFFSSGLTNWSSYIKSGEGSSKGIEILYEKGGERLKGKIAYTYSRTDRYFPDLNKGRQFLAKFDRPHILNVQGDYLFRKSDRIQMGATLLFTFQSGNLESVKSATYHGYLIGSNGSNGTVVLDYYSGFNNLRLQDYIRLDVGWYGKFVRSKVTHNIKAGIYNVLNRHNIFSLYYDNTEKAWKQVYIFPVLPSLNYTIEF